VYGRAQVSLPIVRKFVASVEAAALGVKVVKGVRPDQQLVKVVNDELVRLMGGQQEDLVDPKDGPQARPNSGSVLKGACHSCTQCLAALAETALRHTPQGRPASAADYEVDAQGRLAYFRSLPKQTQPKQPCDNTRW
jgi:hypothetical protein